MKKRYLAFAGLLILSCGYRPVSWRFEKYKTIWIAPISPGEGTHDLVFRLRDALMERCLAGSALEPVDREGADLVLRGTMTSYTEHVIATASDGRTRRLQFNMLANFNLFDREGHLLWSLKNHRYADQFEISTSEAEYRDEGLFKKDQAMEAVAELVIANMTLVLKEQEKQAKEGQL